MRAPTPLTAARWLLDGTLVVLVAVVFTALVVARLLPALGHETVTITGRSMEPTIPLGAAIVLERAAPDAIVPGDIVTLTIPERLITYTHRVVELVDRSDGRWLRTKGDFNGAADPALARADWVVGRPVATLPAIGFLLQLLAMPSGMLAVMGLALTLFLSARLIEELEWDIEEERRPVRPAFPTPTEAHAAAAAMSAAPIPPGGAEATGLAPAEAGAPDPGAGHVERRGFPIDDSARARIRARTNARAGAGTSVRANASRPRAARS